MLLDDRVQDGGGFVDGDANVAWLSGAIRAEVDLPSGVLACLPSREPDASGEPSTWLRRVAR